MPDFKVFSEPDPAHEVTYSAGCHCGKTNFTVTMPSLDKIKTASCNCSICEINGYLNVYPLRKNVNFQSGFEDLGSYRFGTETRAHKFCKTCGTSLMIDFDKTESTELRNQVAVNVRVLKDVDVSKLDIETFNGKSF